MSDIIHLPFLTRTELLDANQEAVNKEYSSYCKQDALADFLTDGNKHPVVSSALDHEGNLVCRILVGPDEAIYVALTQARYNSLPTAPVDMSIIGAMLEASENSKH